MGPACRLSNGRAELRGTAVTDRAAVLNLISIANANRGGETRNFEVRPIFLYGAGLAASGLVFSSIGVVSRLMVVHLIGLEASGTYNASLDLAGQIGGIVAQSVSSVTEPMIFKSFSQGDMGKVQRDFSRGAELLLAAVIPTTVGLVLVSAPLIRLLTGEAFQDTLIQLLPWTIVAVAVSNFNHYYLHIAFQMTNRPVFQIASGVAQFVLLVASSYVLILWNGVLGAVQALLITNLLTMLVTATLARRVFPIPLPWSALLKVSGSALVMTGVVLALPAFPDLPAIELVTKGLTGALVFTTVALVLDICRVRSAGLDFVRRRG